MEILKSIKATLLNNIITDLMEEKENLIDNYSNICNDDGLDNNAKRSLWYNSFGDRYNELLNEIQGYENELDELLNN